jgi:hypothetical protein
LFVPAVSRSPQGPQELIYALIYVQNVTLSLPANEDRRAEGRVEKFKKKYAKIDLL